MRKVMIFAEQSGGVVDDTAREMGAAAAALGDVEVAAVILGHQVSEASTELARWFPKVHVYDDAALEWPDGDLAARILAELVAREKPWLTLIPHTNCGMEIAPPLAARADAPLIADCTRLEAEGNQVTAMRTVFGGKVLARVSAAPGAGGVMATVRPGSSTVPEASAEVGGAVLQETLPAGLAPRRRHREIVAPEPGAVDISQSERLVGVGRGIEEEENLELVQSLAEALGAELAATRPVVDKQWMDRSRQVGTSGTTVKPKLYLAVGVSGSFQHMGGIKGGPFIAAINKDPAAPIFDVADVGIVGDLFDVVPALEEKVREVKGV